MSLEELLNNTNIVMTINQNMDTLLCYIPEIEKMIGFDQKHPHHHYDLWNHTLLALYYSDDEFDVRLALLLHDIGKPYVYKNYNNKGKKYSNLAEESARMAKFILKRLDFDSTLVNRVVYLINNYDKRINNNLIFSDIEVANKLLKVQYCNALAHNSNFYEKKKPYLYTVKQKIKSEETRLYY